MDLRNPPLSWNLRLMSSRLSTSVLKILLRINGENKLMRLWCKVSLCISIVFYKTRHKSDGASRDIQNRCCHVDASDVLYRWIIAIKASLKKWLPLHLVIKEFRSRPSEETRMWDTVWILTAVGLILWIFVMVDDFTWWMCCILLEFPKIVLFVIWRTGISMLLYWLCTTVFFFFFYCYTAKLLEYKCTHAFCTHA